MAKITVPSLIKKGLITPDVSKNPDECWVSEPGGDRPRRYITEKRFGSGRRAGVKVSREGSWKLVSTGKIFSRYQLPSGAYAYKAEGVFFLTTLEEVLAQCGFDFSGYPKEED